MSRRTLLGVSALALLGGCFTERLPEGAQLTCSTDQDCPGGLTCRVAVGRCLDVTKLDTTAPALEGLAEVSPAVAGARSEVGISFRVTEPLFSDPRVLVGTRAAALDEAGTARSERRYRYALVPDGSEPQDRAVVVSVDLVDPEGNTASGLLAGSLRFDFAAPRPAGPAEVQLTAPPRGPIDPVTRVGVGARVSVTVSFEEPLGADPVVEAVWEQADPQAPLADEVLTFQRRGGGPTTFSFEHTLLAASGRPQGRYALRATARDLVGNEATSPLATGFEVDTVPPAAPDVASEGRTVFRREPWGTEGSVGARRMSLRAQAGAVGPAETLLVFSHDPRGELGRGVADQEGAASVPLLFADLSQVWVQAADAAGNVSPEVRVRDVEWVATLAGKVAGSNEENPHQLVSRSWLGHGLLRPVGPSYGATPQGGQALARIDAGQGPGPTLLRQTGEPAWALRDPRRWPQYRCSFGDFSGGGALLAYDVAHEQVVAVAGDGKTWVWNRSGWRKVLTVDPEGDGDPLPRCGAALVYDERRGEVVLVGGLVGAGETWVWNGASWRLAANGTGPSARAFAAVGYDRERGQVVLFGGTPVLQGKFEDTWVWDGKSWQERLPAHVPPRRYAASMAFDPVSRALLMFGGEGNGKDRVADLWRWDGADWSEVKPTPAGAPWPPARASGSMLLDDARGRVLLFGGISAREQPGDLRVWEWDGSQWANRTQAPSPLDLTAQGLLPGRTGMAVYDLARDRVVLFGGYLSRLGAGGTVGDVILDDLWQWDPAQASWEDLTPPRDPVLGLAPTPDRRMGGTMVYDTQRRRTVLFGGFDGMSQTTFPFGTSLADMWSFDGTGWTRLPQTTPWPSGRGLQGMSYDPTRGATVLFGGSTSCDTWEWTGTWRLAQTTVQPCITTAMTAFEHLGALQTVRFGGLALVLVPPATLALVRSDVTARWDGTGWAALSPALKPMARHMAAAASDGQGGALLFGGEASNGKVPEPDPFLGVRLNDTWRWDGAWQSLQANDPGAGQDRPEARFGHSLLFDSSRGRTLLADGYGAAPLSDAWEWSADGLRWERRFPSNPASGELPSPGFARAAAYDRDRERFLFFGGQTATETSEELWELDMGTGERPGHVFSVSLAHSGIPADAVLTGVEARAVAGGRGAGPTDGVEILGWLPEGWQSLASDPAASPEALATVTAQVDPARLGRVRFQDGVHFAIVPRGTNGALPAEVVTDYVEATVRYRLAP